MIILSCVFGISKIFHIPSEYIKISKFKVPAISGKCKVERKVCGYLKDTTIDSFIEYFSDTEFWLF